MEEVIIRNKRFKLIISELQLQFRIQSIAEQINQDYEDKFPLIIGVLNGAAIFTSDLIRNLTVNPELAFFKVSSYGNNMFSEGVEELELGDKIDLKDRHVILVEDIIDTGETSNFLRKYVKDKEPASVKMVSLLFKPDSFLCGKKPEYIGFDIPPIFVVGYGMDFAQEGRGLKGVYQLNESPSSSLI
ncbi:MAG: phosphoribosyltransferase family protein [Bacteroidota bacterium]